MRMGESPGLIPTLKMGLVPEEINFCRDGRTSTCSGTRLSTEGRPLWWSRAAPSGPRTPSSSTRERFWSWGGGEGGGGGSTQVPLLHSTKRT